MTHRGEHDVPRERQSPARVGAAALYRDALRSVIHDLGGVTAALGLRIEVLARRTDPGDAAALQGLVQQVRRLHRALRLLRGPDGVDALAPSRLATGADWWELTEPMTTGLVPHGVRVTSSNLNGLLAPAQAHTLALLWLAAIRELGARKLPSTAQLDVDIDGDPASFRATATTDGLRAARTTTWRRLALQVASTGKATIDWWEPDGDARWLLTVRFAERADHGPVASPGTH